MLFQTMDAGSNNCDDTDLIRSLQHAFGNNGSHKLYENALSNRSNRCHTNTDHDTFLNTQQHDESILDIMEYFEGEDDVTENFGKDVYAYVTPFIIVIGIVGNIMSLCVFLSRRLRALSASHYLAALSASDTIVLVTYVFLDWLTKGLPRWPGHHRVPVIHVNGVCQAFLFISYTSRFVSVYLILVFTIERYIAVCKPLQRRMICTRNFAKKLILMVIVLGAAISIPKPALSGVFELHDYSHDIAIAEEQQQQQHTSNNHDTDTDSDFLDFFKHLKNDNNITTTTPKVTLEPVLEPRVVSDHKVCIRNPDYDSINLVLEVVYGMLITAVPFVLLAFFNMLIMRRLIRRFSVTTKLDISFRENRIRWEFTVMLLVVSSCFILLNIPYFIVWVQQFKSEPNMARILKLSSALALTKTIFYLNYCINFFLYCLTGSYYRTVIREWFHCCMKKNTTNFTNGYCYHHSPSMRKFSQSMSLSTQSTFV